MQGSISYINPGDVISLDYTGDPAGHAGITESLAGSIYNIRNQNADLSSSVYISAGSLSGSNASMHMNAWAGYTVKAIIHHPVSSGGGGSPTLIRPGATPRGSTAMDVFYKSGTNL